jgi:hypothetical protein
MPPKGLSDWYPCPIGRGESRCHTLLVNMIPIFILGFSLFALAKFGIAQWRLILLSAADYQLSESLHLSTGINTASIGPQDFGKLRGFCDGLSPEMKKTSSWLKEVSLYYRIISLFEKLPSLSIWANREMQLCSRYAAVVLDQNLAMNMDRRLAGRTI